MNIFTIILSISLTILKYSAALELSKCSLEDSDCQITFLSELRNTYARTGIPEIGLYRLEPFDLADVNMVIMQLINITLIEGQASGIVNCTGLSFETDVEKMERKISLMCDRIVIEGNYTIQSNPIAEKIFGGPVRGSGNLSIELNDWYINITNPFKFVKRDDGYIYQVIMHEKGTYGSKVLKSIVFNADNIEVGGCDKTNTVLDYMNSNWKLIFDTFGERFNKLSIDYDNDAYDIFYNTVPATEYLSDDLNQYINSNCSQCE